LDYADAALVRSVAVDAIATTKEVTAVTNRSHITAGPVASSVLDCIGNTPLVELRHVVPPDCGRVFVKLEAANPTGSMKDRMALAMITAAELDGRLPVGGTVVEYTGGSTGVSLAQVCAAKGHPLRIVTSDAYSVEKRRHMESLGAELTLVESNGGATDAALTHAMIDAAAEIAAETNGYWTDQLRNVDQLSGYRAMGDEIWAQTDGEVDAFVQSVGTAGSIMGIAGALRARASTVRVVAVEPEESAVLSGGPSGSHFIEGVGAGFVVPLWDAALVDDIVTVSSSDAMAMSRRIAKEEAIFAGTSTGANVLAAIETARQLGPGSTVVTVACDSGTKYLSTRLFQNEEP
jgi:cysteine synthase A